MPPMERDGNLTGIVTSPDLPLPSRWLDGLEEGDEPAVDGLHEAQPVAGALMNHYSDIIAALDGGF